MKITADMARDVLLATARNRWRVHVYPPELLVDAAMAMIEPPLAGRVELLVDTLHAAMLKAEHDAVWHWPKAA